MHFPLDKHIVDSICRQFGLRNFDELGNASIRQLAGVVCCIEQAAHPCFDDGDIRRSGRGSRGRAPREIRRSGG